MAQSGFLPIQLYFSSTASAAPSAGNLANGEVALNITDGKLYYKDNLGAVQLLASKISAAGVLSFQTSLSGLTPSTSTSGAVTLAGTLGIASGGTGLTALGTGVQTAFGINVGTAGAFVVNGGALGTPTSGTVTNLTGTASISINGTVGATSANSGAFTTLSASSTVSGTGFSNYLASPPAIGSTAAGTGAFTTLSASSTVSGVGFTNYFASPPTIGNTAANTGRFTTLTATGALSVAGDSAFTSTGALQLPVGTTGQQPAGVAGKIRYNSTTAAFEGYSGGVWAAIGGSGGGGAALSNDTSTASYEYPLFASATSGTPTTIYTSNAKFLYKPSTGDRKSVV